MQYNRSEIMKAANAYAKSMSRKGAFCKAWREGKEVARKAFAAGLADDQRNFTSHVSKMVDIASVQKGDILYMAAGWGEWMPYTVKSIYCKDCFSPHYCVHAMPLGCKTAAFDIDTIIFTYKNGETVRKYNALAS